MMVYLERSPDPGDGRSTLIFPAASNSLMSFVSVFRAQPILSHNMSSEIDGSWRMLSKKAFLRASLRFSISPGPLGGRCGRTFLYPLRIWETLVLDIRMCLLIWIWL